MPLLSITTNADIEQLHPDALIAKCSSTVAAMLGKPESYVLVSVQHNPYMLFAGSSDPLAYLELKSINLPEDDTSRLSTTLSELVGDALQIPAERIYIEFANAQRHMWGWNKTTFAR